MDFFVVKKMYMFLKNSQNFNVEYKTLFTLFNKIERFYRENKIYYPYFNKKMDYYGLVCSNQPYQI